MRNRNPPLRCRKHDFGLRLFLGEFKTRDWGLVGIPNLERPKRSFVQVMAGVIALSLILALGLGHHLAFVWVVHQLTPCSMP